jgi:hypothetical protein
VGDCNPVGSVGQTAESGTRIAVEHQNQTQNQRDEIDDASDTSPEIGDAAK